MEKSNLSVIDLLLKPEAINVQAQLPTGQYKIKRLSDATGEPVVFQLRALPYGRTRELQQMQEDMEIHILLQGCVSPDLKDPRLIEKFGGVVPAEMVKNMLLPGEIEDLSRAIERLSGYRKTTIEEVKNA